MAVPSARSERTVAGGVGAHRGRNPASQNPIHRDGAVSHTNLQRTRAPPAAPRRWEPCSPSIGAAVWVAGPDCFRTAGGSCNRFSAIAAWNARSRWREAFPDAQRTMNVQVAALLPGARTRGVAFPWLSSGNGGPGGARTGARLPRGARARGACWPWDGPPVSERFGGCRFAMKRQLREARSRFRSAVNSGGAVRATA
jgi:hypothetical protein